MMKGQYKYKSMQKIQGCANNSRFCREFSILQEIQNFPPKIKILPKIQEFAENSRFCTKFKILQKIQDFAKNSTSSRVWEKFKILEISGLLTRLEFSGLKAPK